MSPQSSEKYFAVFPDSCSEDLAGAGVGQEMAVLILLLCELRTKNI